MNKKVIATILALGMVAGAFAMMAVPAKAADPMTWHFYDTTSWGDERIRLTTSDGTNPNGGVARWVVVDTPAQVPTDVTTDLGSPMPSMAAWIGAAGRAAMDNYVQIATSAGQTNPTAGEPIVFFLEKDPNIAAAPQVYNPTSAAAPVGGTVPHGYIWAAPDVFSWTGDNEPLMSGSPPTTFFEVLEMPAATFVGTDFSWAGVTGPADVAGGAAGTNSQIVTWQLYESVGDNNGPWTQVGSANFGTAISYPAAVSGNYYSVGVTFTAGVKSTVLSTPVLFGGAPPTTFPPEATALLSTPAVHNGNTLSEQVIITATITDPDGIHTITNAAFTVDGGTIGPFGFTAVDGAYDEISEDVTGTFMFPNPFTEGAHTFEVHGMDSVDGWNATWTQGTFTITDTTAPLAAWDTVPPSDWYIGSDLTFTATYEDFSDVQAAGSYLTWSLNAVPQANVPFVMTFDGFGSYLYTATATIATGAMVAGDVVTYGGQVTAASAGPQTTPLAAGGPITLADAPTIVNPFAVFGSVVLYDGTSVGGYNPIQAGAGVPVSATYWDFALGALRTVNAIGGTDASGFYTIDIMNAVLGDPYGIELVAGPFVGYGNMGYDSIPVLDYSVTGGILNDVVCGIPYEVVITAPLPLFNTNAGALMPTTYVVLDIDGLPAQGYFSFEGAMDWTSTDLAFTNVDGPITFDGVADAGTHTGNLIMMTAGPQTIRIADEDGGVAPPAAVGTNMFLTPWGDFGPVLIGGVSTPVYLDDWDEIIVNVMADQFFWNLVAGGWNLVSAPTNPVDKGLDGVFDADDAMNVCLVSDPTNVGLQMATKTGASTYNVVLLGVGELGAFDIDSVHGYWIFSDVADVVGFYGIDYDIVADPTLNVVTTNAGWNLLGFTHNYNGGVWGAIPTASDFCDGTIGPGLGAATMIIATEWDYAAQWYYSYVNTPTFVMPTRDWAWDFSYAGSPGNGFYLWTEAPIVITFNVVY